MPKHIFKNENVAIDVVADNNRLNFLPAYFGNDFMKAENAIYRVANQVIEGYNGGYWEYAVVRLQNGMSYPFAFVKTELEQEKLTLSNPFSGDEVEIDPVLAGMIVTIYACNLLETDRGYEVASVLTSVAYDYADETKQSKSAFIMLD